MNRFNIRCSMVLAVVCFLFGLAPLARAAVYSDLYNFAGHSTDGISPRGSLIQVGSLLYGMTTMGGPGVGTVFSFNPSTNAEIMLYSFGTTGNNDGALPNGSLLASGSTLYGMTSSGGSNNAGAIFSFNTSNNTEIPLYSFGSNTNDGGGPAASLILIGSTAYGMTTSGGSGNQGTIFSYNLGTHNESVAYSFQRYSNGEDDGAVPYGSLTESGSTLYGLTSQGGSNGITSGGYGVIFAYNTLTQTEAPIYSFVGGNNDGALPRGSLLQSGSILYGTTSEGGAYGGGTLFDFNTQTGIEDLLYSFGANTNDGTDPRGSLTLVGDALYGTTEDGGGSLNDGTIFGYDLSTDTETVLHSFQGTDGANPTGDLLAVGDTLYGLASNGGTHGDGVIFSVAIPEPATITLLLAGGIGLLAHRPRRRNSPL
jgi:uncharacterized repeat protein (TIGR03803 family)